VTTRRTFGGVHDKEVGNALGHHAGARRRTDATRDCVVQPCAHAFGGGLLLDARQREEAVSGPRTTMPISRRYRPLSPDSRPLARYQSSSTSSTKLPRRTSSLTWLRFETTSRTRLHQSETRFPIRSGRLLRRSSTASSRLGRSNKFSVTSWPIAQPEHESIVGTAECCGGCLTPRGASARLGAVGISRRIPSLECDGDAAGE
jgi:hypothetical protein